MTEQDVAAIPKVELALVIGGRKFVQLVTVGAAERRLGPVRPAPSLMSVLAACGRISWLIMKKVVVSLTIS